ncbi:unnamed protein product, partial [Rotaria sp. Silwood2]
MARTKSLISSEFSQFADDYDVYVDYGKGRPIKMNNNEAAFIDVEKFLMEQNHLPKSTHNKKSNEVLETNVTNRSKISIKNSKIHNSTKNDEQT